MAARWADSPGRQVIFSAERDWAEDVLYKYGQVIAWLIIGVIGKAVIAGSLPGWAKG